MPVLKSTYDQKCAKYEAEVGRLVRRIEALSEERNMWREDAESRQESYEVAFDRWGEQQRRADILEAALREARDGVIEIRVLADAAGRACAHQHADLERMTHERNEALSCMVVYGLVIDQLLDEGDELRAVADDLQREIGELVDCQMLSDDPAPVLEIAAAAFVVDLSGCVSVVEESWSLDYVGQAA